MRGDTGPRAEAPIASVEELNAAIVSAYPDLLRRALFLTRDREDATDLVHRTVERACVSRNQFKVGSSARHWLGAILTNQFIDEVRRHRSNPIAHGMTYDNISGPPADVRPVWTHLELEDVLVAVRRVPDRYRIPFELHALRKLSHREIGLRLRLPLGTVGTRIHRAKLALRQLLSERALKRMAVVTLALPAVASRRSQRESAIADSPPRVPLEERPDHLGGVEVARGGAAG